MAEQGDNAAWECAQGMKLSIDLIAAAKNQLELLEIVDQNPYLYEDRSILQCAIHRYIDFWLPMVAANQQTSNFPLVAPLDCAWIWHCHRLNPLRYAKDCKRLFGKIVDAPVVSSEVKNVAMEKTKSLWTDNYPEEPYIMEMSSQPTGGIPSSYNLIDAVLRQKSFYYQVSEPHYKEESFLKAAEERYKGFLYLMQKNKQTSTFFVPTYDIDLMWHAHQLSPVAYNKDTVRILGYVLDHDDTDSDRTKGRKLDTGFTKTSQLWHNTYGFPYEKAGCSYRGERPRTQSMPPEVHGSLQECDTLPLWKDANLTRRKTLQVRMAVHSARYVPTKNVSSTFISLSTYQNCSEFNTQTSEVKATVNPEFNKLWLLECDASIGGLILELRQRTKGIFKGIKGSSSLVGSLTITWKMIMQSSTLSLNGWFPLLSTDCLNRDDIASLHIDVSVTPPVEAPHIMKFIKVKGTKLFSRERVSLARVIDHTKEEVYKVKTSFAPENVRTIQVQLANKENEGGPVLVSFTRGQAVHTRQWSLYGTSGILTIRQNVNREVKFEALGNFGSPVEIIYGRQLEFKLKGSKNIQENCATLIRYTLQAPNGKATAFFNWKTGDMEVMPGESAMLVAAFLAATAASLSDMPYEVKTLKSSFTRSRSSIHLLRGASHIFTGHRRSTSAIDTPSSLNKVENASGCGAGCGGGCGGCGALNNIENAAGCGGGCGGCGSLNKEENSAGCGAGCGGGCGSAVNKS